MTAVAYNQFPAADLRREPREEVHFRARAMTGAGRPIELLVVNVSAHGMMARCTDESLCVDDRLTIRLPEAGALPATIRWALGGRLGCEFDGVIPLSSYMRMLATVLAR